MATRDQMIADALTEVKVGLKELGNKFDNKMDNYREEMKAFQVQYAGEMAALRTQVKIYAGIAGSIGAVAGGVIVKLIWH